MKQIIKLMLIQKAPVLLLAAIAGAAALSGELPVQGGQEPQALGREEVMIVLIGCVLVYLTEEQDSLRHSFRRLSQRFRYIFHLDHAAQTRGHLEQY